MVSPATQRRIDRFSASLSTVLVEYERAKRWNQPAKIEAFGTAASLLDACICAEEAAQPFAQPSDAEVVGRLRDIAIARGLLAKDRDKPQPAELEIDAEIAGNPLVQAVLERFPGAEIVDVRHREL